MSGLAERLSFALHKYELVGAVADLSDRGTRDLAAYGHRNAERGAPR